MKANELMIGDWVLVRPFSDSEPVKSKITAINYNSYRGKDYTDWVDAEFWDELSLNQVEPIPLTPEILEKNGFKPYIPENHLETVYACQDVSKAIADELYALWPYQDGSFYLLLRVDRKDMVRMDVHYIHQLQHALRLCGIDKTIEL